MEESQFFGSFPADSPGAAAAVRVELLARKVRLAQVAGSAPREAARLLVEVDAALERLAGDAWGSCDRCDDGVELERLRANPLVRVCLGCLNEAESRALERDLELAATIQAALLPGRHLRHAGWEVAYRYLPLGPVSGDHCDVLPPATPGDPLHVVLGDVSGKGVAAALLMAHLQAALRSLARMDLPLGALVGRANRLMAESTLVGSYTTMVIGRLGDAGEVELVNAGHCPPILVRPGAVTRLSATGVPLGLIDDAVFATRRVKLDPGDLLFVYTDGLSEAGNGHGDELGADRVANTLVARSGADLDELLDASIDAATRFGAGAPRTDDLTVMAIRRTT